MPSSRSPGAEVFWQPQPEPGKERGRGRGGRRGRDTQALIGAAGEPIEARETRGGEFFYRFHFDLQYMPIIFARWLVGIAALAMLVAILSGIVTHKKIFRDFFTLRRGKGQRSWLDGHNATAVLALPFHLMITYTGLVTLMAMLMPWAVIANYSDTEKLFEKLFPSLEEVERSHTPARLTDLVAVVHDAERRMGGAAGFISVSEPGDTVARITVSQSNATLLSSRTPSLTYDGVTGKVIWQRPAPGAAALTDGVMIGLHSGRFADYGMRWLYFLCGVGGCVMVASGLVLWTVKRREKLTDPARPHFGFRLVEWLNISVVGGFPFAIAAFLWANRLLPLALKGRAQWEVHSLFIAWGLALVVALVVPRRHAWTALLGATGALLAAIPVYNLAATSRGLFATLSQEDWMLAGVDLVLIAFGLAFLAVARRVASHRAGPARVRQRRDPAADKEIGAMEPAE
jgi:uncharacterized iron-regulated membrane protein